MNDIQQIRADRFRFLQAYYEFSGGDLYKWAPIQDVGNFLGFDRSRTQNIAHFLAEEGLLKFWAIGGHCGITHAGIVEVENALSRPETPSHYFPATSTIHIESMVNSVIQQNSPNAIATIRVDATTLADIANFLNTLESSLPHLGLTDTAASDVSAEIGTIRSQLSSSRPKNSVIGECISSIRNVIEGCAGSVIATNLLNTLSTFPV